MTSLFPENTVPQPIPQDKTEAVVTPQNIEDNPPQEKTESTPQNTITTGDEDPNWKAFREARKQDRAEREAAERRAAEAEEKAAALTAAMETAFSRKGAPTPDAYNQYYGMNQESEETEDQRIEKKVNKLLADREENLRREQQERERREYPNKLARDYPDFANVCSAENLDYLDYNFPELSRPLQRLPDGYDKWSDIYHAVKKFIPNHAGMRKEAAKADANGNKPKSMSSTQLSPPGQPVAEPWQDTEARRAENWSRMQKTMKGVG